MSHEASHELCQLGTCCCCERIERVNSVIMLENLAPIPGRGWGCVVCDLPNNGAVYVCCDECLKRKVPPRFACRGYPGTDGRVPIGELDGVYVHDLTKHPEERFENGSRH